MPERSETERGDEVGARTQSREELPKGTLLKGQYRIKGLLGTGGFGNTYLAWDDQARVDVAVKEYLHKGSGMRLPDGDAGPRTELQRGTWETGLKYFRSEATTLHKLQANQHIVPVRAVFSERGTAYMVMQYIRGDNLAKLLNIPDDGPATEIRPLPEERVRQILLDLLDGLAIVHKARIVHRDIKPQNVMLDEDHDGAPVLIDFGASRLIGLETGNIMHSPPYTAPEQYGTKGQGPETDIYSLGVLAYIALAGKEPPAAPDRGDELCVPVRKAAGENPVSARFGKAVDRAISMKRSDRPQTVEELREEIELPPTNWWKMAAAGFVGVTVALAVIVWHYIPNPPEWKECAVVDESSGETELHGAAEADDSARLRDLIETERCDPDQRDYSGESPLHQAVLFGRRDAMLTLLTMGAQPNAVNTLGYTALHYSGFSPNGRRERGVERTVSEENAAELASALLKRGATVDARGLNGRTPLLTAASTGQLGVVRELLDAGADLEQREIVNRRTALHLAYQLNQCDVVDELLKAGADSEATDNGGRRPSELNEGLCSD